MANLSSEAALITGGTRGMGAGHARRLSADGANIVIADILDDEGQKLAAELGDRALFTHLDVTSEDSWNEAVESARSKFGPVTSLVNNASVELAAPLHEVTSEQFDWIIGVNLKGCFLGIKAVIPDMIAAKTGSIVKYRICRRADRLREFLRLLLDESRHQRPDHDRSNRLRQVRRTRQRHPPGCRPDADTARGDGVERRRCKNNQ